MINGDAVEKGPLCQKIVVLFFRTVDDIRDDSEIEAWMVSPGLDPAIVRVPGGATKQDLEDCIDEAAKILQDAYQPESTREDLVIAVADALTALEGDMGEDGGDDEEEDDGQV